MLLPSAQQGCLTMLVLAGGGRDRNGSGTRAKRKSESDTRDAAV